MEVYRQDQLTLPQEERAHVADALIGALLREQNLERGVQILYEVLGAYIPFTQVLLCSLDKRTSMLTPWTVLEEGQIVPAYEALYLPPEFPFSDPLAVGEHIFVENDIPNSPLRRELFMSGKKSLLNMKLHEDDIFLITMSLHAMTPHQFTRRHAAILSMLHEPLSLLMSSFIRQTPQFGHPQQTRSTLSSWELLGQCRGLRQVTRQIEAVAPTSGTTLILGETGVGKELVADSVHRLSRCARGPMIKVNCASMTDTLIDSELFGHEKGAFTNAVSLHQGYFEQAHNGTLFLDEVGELGLSAQARLLRVIETRELQRVGGQRRIPVNVRLVAATNRNIPAMVAAGAFRQDLWFRLQAFPIVVPPLRQRREDITVLLQYAYQTKIQELGLQHPPKLTPGVMAEALSYSWPGNVRQLLLWVERALILAHSQGERELRFDPSPMLPFGDDAVPSASRSPRSLDEHSALYIRQALEQCGGRIHGAGGAAEVLGIHPNTLRSRMKKLGVAKGGRTRA